MNKLMIIGASGHGKVIADIARLTGYTEIAFLDDDPKKQTCGFYPVIGSANEWEKDCDIIVGIGNAVIRERIQRELPAEQLVTLVHPHAVIGEDVVIGPGTVVMAGAVLNPGTVIGAGCIINTCSSVDHDCHVADYVHIAVGAHLCGNVRVGDHSWVGAGAILINNITVSHECVIGAGAVVVRSISEPGTYLGIPAQRRK